MLPGTGTSGRTKAVLKNGLSDSIQNGKLLNGLNNNTVLNPTKPYMAAIHWITLVPERNGSHVIKVVKKVFISHQNVLDLHIKIIQTV
jgi:hypothetical protein